jgi:hypothetical protein
MGLGTITLLGMLCTPGQVPADCTTWNNPSMKIPIDYHPSKRGEIKELLLYVSADQGQSWQHHATATPDKDTNFTFNAPADGIYWFNMVIVDKSGRRDPADVFKVSPALKVLFDTKKPVVNIASAQRTGDDVTVVWKIIEKNPDWSKFRLEYSTNGANWISVPTRPEADGSTQFKLTGAGTASVRISLTDVAGHSGEAIAQVAGAATTTAAAKPTNDPLIPVTGTSDLPTPPLPGAPVDRNKDIRSPADPKGTDSSAPPIIMPPTPGGPAIDSPVGPAPKDPVGVSTPASYLPAPQVINVTTFKVAYEVEDKGTSGVGKAEIWVTRDEGRTWRKWADVEKPESPLVIDLAKNSVKDSKEVEGIYGIKVLLQSGAGLSREAPKGGEAPDLRVEVDLTAPVVTIYKPVPDPAQKDTMILRWTVTDRNLAPDPITIEWADGPRGPWVPVAATEALGVSGGVPKRLPNTGSYAWKLPTNFPTHKVYLKVTARDMAGNTAEAVSSEPVLVDLNKPMAVKLNIVGGGSK